MSLHESAIDMRDELVRLRHALHREPEIGLDLPRTQEKVLDALAGLPLEITTGDGAQLGHRGAARLPARARPVLLRGDMDALPRHRGDRRCRTPRRYDGRCTPAATTCTPPCWPARRSCSAARRTSCAGNVIFMFQPGEEGQGGARHMIDEGVLDAAGERPVAAYALHVMLGACPRAACSPPGRAR